MVRAALVAEVVLVTLTAAASHPCSLRANLPEAEEAQAAAAEVAAHLLTEEVVVQAASLRAHHLARYRLVGPRAVESPVPTTTPAHTTPIQMGRSQ